ncbi:Protein kinase C-binding protein 1 [Schistosoma japonicum]|nr:Protein kinase C-binding protein 1 [Schistosoma japonicum]KAH8861581.1 Protein kinase C-binding protein 1 [Schistosoma japonicum]
MDDQVNENKSNAESVVSVGLTVPYVLVQAIPTVSSPSRKRRSLSSAIGRLKRLKLLKEQKPYCESNVPPVDVDVTTSVINTQSDNDNASDSITAALLDTTSSKLSMVNTSSIDPSKQSIVNSPVIAQSNSFFDTTTIINSSSNNCVRQPSKETSLLSKVRFLTNTTHDRDDPSLAVIDNSSKIFAQCLSGSESEEYTGCNDGVGNHHDSEISALSTTAIMITTDGATFDQMNAITKGHHYSLTFQNNPVKSQTISLNDGSVLNEINNQVNDNNIGSINCSANNMSNEKQDLSEGKIFTNGQNSESDDYCWICHNPGEVVICSCCPRVFHSSCLYMTDFPDVWLCPECQDLILAECSLYQLKSWCTITNDQLKRMLLFLLDRLSRQSWAQHFREPVNPTFVKGYNELITHPMDLHLLYSRVKSGEYASPQAFLGDFRWILHNCIVFNGTNSSLTSSARLLDRTFHREFNLMRACPICYLNRMPAIHLLPSTSKKLPPLTDNEPGSYLLFDVVPTHSSSGDDRNEGDSGEHNHNHCKWKGDSSLLSALDPWWFCKLCDVIHPIVWVRLQNYPRWPAKVMAHDGSTLLVSFFGDYDVTIAPIGSAKLHSVSLSKRLRKSSMDSGYNNSNIVVSPCSAVSDVDADNETIQTTSQSPTSSSTVPIIDPDVKQNYRKAVAELKYHLDLIYQHPNTDINSTVMNTTQQVICNTTSSTDANTVTSNDTVHATNSVRINFSSKLDHLQPSNDLYREPLLTRFAASLRHSPIISSELPSGLKTASLPIISNGDTVMKRKHVDTPQSTSSVSPSITMELETVSSEDIHCNATLDHKKKKRKKKKHGYSKSKLLAEGGMNIEENTINTISIIDSSETSNDADNINNIDSNVIADNDASSSNSTTEPLVLLTSCELQPISDILVSSTSSKLNDVRLALDDLRASFNEALQRLEDKVALTINSANDSNVGHLLNTPELPSLHPIRCDIEIQTDDIQFVGNDKSLKTSNATTESKSIQTDTSSSSLSTLNPRLPISFQERMMQSEILRMERENQRLNVLVAYTRAEMLLEMERRITELRRVWNHELIAIMETAARIWERDVIKIVDACAYCGRIAYYYCCWNTSYCNVTCQSKHWSFHINSCVQARNLANNTNNNNRNLNGLTHRPSHSPNLTCHSLITTTDQSHYSSTQPSLHQHPPQYHQYHHTHDYHNLHQQPLQQQTLPTHQRMISRDSLNPIIDACQSTNNATLQRSLSFSTVPPSTIENLSSFFSTRLKHSLTGAHQYIKFMIVILYVYRLFVSVLQT